MGENFCQGSNQQEINLQNIETTHAVQHQKQLDLKNGQKTKDCFQKGWSQADEKMLNVTKHEGNANQNYNEVITSHLSE